MDAVKACDDQFKTYYRESEGDLYYVVSKLRKRGMVIA